MTREFESTLKASAIQWPALRNHIPCMAHVIQLDLGAVMCSLGVNDRTKSWEAHERNQQFGQNESMHIEKSQRLRKEDNARINKVFGHETRFSQDNWESAYFIIFWKSWNWPSYSRECLLYWLLWHLVVETCSMSVKRAKFALLYYQLWMWRHGETQYCNCWSPPTDYGNSHGSHSKIRNTQITGHISQLKMSGQLWSMSWKYWGNFDIGPCGCQRGIPP